MGVEDRLIVPRRTLDPEHSIGADETFGHDSNDPVFIKRELLRLSARVSSRMRKAGLCGRTVTLKVRYANFKTITRARSLPDNTDTTPTIYATAVDLYDALGITRERLRLVGVRVQHLVDNETVSRQLVLGAREPGWDAAERAVDRAVARFGKGIVKPAVLVGEHGRS